MSLRRGLFQAKFGMTYVDYSNKLCKISGEQFLPIALIAIANLPIYFSGLRLLLNQLHVAVNADHIGQYNTASLGHCPPNQAKIFAVYFAIDLKTRPSRC